MKAFIANEPYENRGDVFFANHNIVARRMAADELNDGELVGMTCRRAPGLDHLEGDRRAIVWELLEMGWWFDDGAITLDWCPNVFVTKGGGVYHSPFDWLGAQEHLIQYRSNRN